MIYYLLVFSAGLIFSVGLLFLKKPFFSFALSTTALLNAVLDTDSDEDTKQKLLISRLGPLLANMFVFLALLLLCIGIASVPLAKYLWFDTEFVPDTSSIYFYLCLGFGSIIPFLLPVKGKTDSDYSDWSMLLHRMILNNSFIGRALFQLERRLFREKLKKEPQPFVIVTGLARAGTTALTNLLFNSGNFHSLAYNNMPFILSPNIWGKFYRTKDEALKERAHGDQIEFGLDTIEALEEVFFKAFLNDSFIGEEFLTKHELTEAVSQKYRDYRNLIAVSKPGSTYLAKNNNLILRYNSIQALNEDLRTVVIFRDPLEHAASLLSQHNRFSKLHTEEPFSLEYMNWLGHHEFGLNHKPFNLGQERNPFNTTSINYWLWSWIDYHAYLLALSGSSSLFLIDYSDLLSRPAYVLELLQSKLEITLSNSNIKPFNPREKKPITADEDLKAQAYKLHGQLRLKALGAQ